MKQKPWSCSKVERELSLNNKKQFHHNKNFLLSFLHKQFKHMLHSGQCQWMFLLCCISGQMHLKHECSPKHEWTAAGGKGSSCRHMSQPIASEMQQLYLLSLLMAREQTQLLNITSNKNMNISEFTLLIHLLLLLFVDCTLQIFFCTKGFSLPQFWFFTISVCRFVVP